MSSLPNSGFINFTVKGLTESIKGLDGILHDWPIVRKAVLFESGRFLVNEAKTKVHVVSGDLKNSISIEPTANNNNSIIVSAKTRYAKIENDRKGDKHPTGKSKPPYGPHNYFTQAVEITEKDFQSRIKVNFDKVLSRHRTK